MNVEISELRFEILEMEENKRDIQYELRETIKKLELCNEEKDKLAKKMCKMLMN